MSMEKERANSGNGATLVQGNSPKSPHMLAIGLLNFIHQTQRSGKWIGEGDPHGGQSLGESVGQEVQNVSAPGEPAAIAAGLA